MNITMKQSLLAIALAGAFSFANAATIAIPGSAGPLNISLGTNPTGADDYAVTRNRGSFDDFFNFSIISAPTNSGSVAELQNILSGFNITGGMLSLYQDVGPAGKDAGDILLGTDAFEARGLGNAQIDSLLADGNYFYEVSGTAVGTKGGRYDFVATSLPVPEPETYALMLAGLGVISFIGRRRLSKFA